MSEARCKGCQARIVWVEAKNAKGEWVKIPLDPKATCYHVVRDDDRTPLGHRAKHVMVSHFATCPVANEQEDESGVWLGKK